MAGSHHRENLFRRRAAVEANRVLPTIRRDQTGVARRRTSCGPLPLTFTIPRLMIFALGSCVSLSRTKSSGHGLSSAG